MDPNERPMPLPIGARLGSFVIEAAIGAGGMGEVYRARDSKLGRNVAIKVLPDLFATDGDRLERFEREAKVLASLNHPNIAHIYGIEDSNGASAIVMELVDGQTLADLIAASSTQGRAVPLEDAISIAIAVAEALEAAHDQGIIHRDLKPANVKVRSDGAVKVLDFGLAKALEPAPQSSASAMMSPTISIHGTQAGLILGTAGYMSPEQARGKPVDRRADIWAFGILLFEMLSGRRPFDDGDVSEVIASILKSEPVWQALPGDTPIALSGLLRRCLQKDPKQRLQHIGDARVELQELQRAAPSTFIVRPRGPIAWRERMLWILALAAVAIGSAVAISRRVPAEPPELRLEISTPPTQRPSSFALSPDGSSIVYNADGSAGPQLWLRQLNSTTIRPLAGTEVGLYPFWSPDGRSIGFFTNNRLKVLDIDGGQVNSLTNVITPAGGTWNADNTILFVRSDNSAVLRIASAGGTATPVTPPRTPELATRLPQFLPDGRHYVFYVARGGEPAGVYVGELDRERIHKVLDTDWPAMYASGRLWFVRGTTLFAQPFSTTTLQVSGQATRVAEDVRPALFASSFSVSAAGHVAYRNAMPLARQLRWFNRSGKELGSVGEEGMAMSNPSLSRDDRFVVVQRTDRNNNIDLWSLDLTREGDFVRLTVNPGIDSMPLWSPDRRKLVFNTLVDNVGGLAIRQLDGRAPDEILPLSTGPRIVCDWSVDGRFILYKQFDQQSATTDLWALPMQGNKTPFPVAQGPSDERDGQFSPDGKWVAYDSDQSGRPAIYIQPFPEGGERQPVSTAGGSQPRWRSDGRELFYIAPDGYLMAVPMGTAAGPSNIGKPVRLFKTRLSPFSAISRQQYVVDKEGQRFLMVATDDVPTPPITIILNWKDRSHP